MSYFDPIGGYLYIDGRKFMADNEGHKYEIFDDLIIRYRDLIRRLCWRNSSGSEVLCNELVQECYISIWYHIASLRPGAHALQQMAWVVWQCRSVFSHHHRQKVHDWLPLNEQIADTFPEQNDHKLRETIEDLAISLSDKERSTLSLMLEGFQQREIAIKMGIKPDSVNKTRQRIIQKMQQVYINNISIRQ